jgi:biopolymer transport protein ExbB
VMGFMRIFFALQRAGPFANVSDLAGGVWASLISMAAGLAVAIPAYAAYNYLVSRVNSIVLDMEKASAEIINIVTETSPPNGR